MDIRNVVPMGTSLKALFAEVLACVEAEKDFVGTNEILSFFEKTYGCNHVSRYYKAMKW